MILLKNLLFKEFYLNISSSLPCKWAIYMQPCVSRRETQGLDKKEDKGAWEVGIEGAGTVLLNFDRGCKIQK